VSEKYDLVGCEAFLMTLSEYLDDELEDRMKTQFEKHLQYCVNARAMVRTVKHTIELHRRAGGAEAPDVVHTRLQEFLERYGDEE